MDKFGHHINKRLRLSEFFEIFDKALMQTENDELVSQSTRLTGVTSPSRENDAVNKEYVDKQSVPFVKKDEVHSILKAIKLDIEKYNPHLKEDYFKKVELEKIIKSTSKE